MSEPSIRDRAYVAGLRGFIRTVRHTRTMRLLRRLAGWVNRPRQARVRPLPPASPIPKRLWLYWHQGEDNAPRVIAQCLQSWKDLNPAWEVRVLNQQSIEEEIQLNDLPQDISIQALSDVVRLRLLRKYGGVWADATIYAIRPLDDWLPSVAESGFFAFRLRAPDRLIGSGFLAAASGSPLTAAWESVATRYWQVRRRSDAYYWVHYLFEAVTIVDPVCGAIWAQTPRVESQENWRVFHTILAAKRNWSDRRRTELIEVAKRAHAQGAPFQHLTYREGLADRDARECIAECLGSDWQPPERPGPSLVPKNAADNA